MFVFWELPQNVLGAALLGVAWASGRLRKVRIERGRIFIECRGFGVSLGLFIFWFHEGNRYFTPDSLMRRHEYGHSFQSRWLGPFYLLAVGVPSVARVLYGVAYREVTGRTWRRYYAGYPENWADRLGGISRTERAQNLDVE